METKNIAKSPEKLAILEKIKELEEKGIFDQDVENDPEGKVLMPKDIKYLNKSPLAEIKRFIAFWSATRYFNKLVKNKQIIINDIKGLENLYSVEGAILTCNHFNPFDSFVMQYIFRKSKHKKRMYRVIREGNYTGFKGFYGFLMRNCDTLPLSSNTATMKKFYIAVEKALQKKNCVLVYPEQSMWWNYRKPKPLKNGAFHMAVKNNVPVVPCFITLEDSDIIGDDGFPIQIYTAHIGKPIYRDTTLNKIDAIEKMKQDNYSYFKSVYEDFYKTPLKYNIKKG